jgi:hypothetical protein
MLKTISKKEIEKRLFFDNPWWKNNGYIEPSTLVSIWKASSASLSVIATYCARPESFR